LLITLSKTFGTTNQPQKTIHSFSSPLHAFFAEIEISWIMGSMLETPLSFGEHFITG
jgi:hypothetical protein